MAEEGVKTGWTSVGGYCVDGLPVVRLDSLSLPSKRWPKNEENIFGFAYFIKMSFSKWLCVLNIYFPAK